MPADQGELVKPVEAPQEIKEPAKPQAVAEAPKVEETKAVKEPEKLAPVAEKPTDNQMTKPENTKTYEEGIIAGLQEAIIAIMEKNGPVTEQMRRDVLNNTHHDSLIIWVKSFR